MENGNDYMTYPMLSGHHHNKDQLGNGETADDHRPGEQTPGQPSDQTMDEDRGGHKHHKVLRAKDVGGVRQVAVRLQNPRHLT